MKRKIHAASLSPDLCAEFCPLCAFLGLMCRNMLLKCASALLKMHFTLQLNCFSKSVPCFLVVLSTMMDPVAVSIVVMTSLDSSTCFWRENRATFPLPFWLAKMFAARLASMCSSFSFTGLNSVASLSRRRTVRSLSLKRNTNTVLNVGH